MPPPRARRRCRGGAAAACVAVLLAGAAAVPTAPADAAPPRAAAARAPRTVAGRKAARIALKGKLASVSRQITTTRTELRRAKRTEAATAAGLEAIRERLTRTRARLRAARSRLDRTRAEQRKVGGALARSQKRLRDRELRLARRMAANYRQGPVRYASVLLGSRSMGEFVSRAHFVRTVVRYDATLIAGIKADREDVLRWKAQVDGRAREVEGLKQELAARQAEETQALLEQRALLAEARANRAEWEDELDALHEDSTRIAARIRALQETPGGRARRMVAFVGGFIRPVGGAIVSGFGSRFHPILHRTRLHAGVDFASGEGTPIAAAAAGVVVFSGTMRGYGNVVVIDHGGGVSTLYAHCSALLVGDGANVRRGQVIARVGATGLATGPHLHFEVRKNGAPVNPLAAL